MSCTASLALATKDKRAAAMNIERSPTHLDGLCQSVDKGSFQPACKTALLPSWCHGVFSNRTVSIVCHRRPEKKKSGSNSSSHAPGLPWRHARPPHPSAVRRGLAYRHATPVSHDFIYCREPGIHVVFDSLVIDQQEVQLLAYLSLSLFLLIYTHSAARFFGIGMGS